MISTTGTTTEALYTVGQLADACGVSRSTLLRLEDEGLLIPTIHDTKRMYSFLDMMKLRQIITLHNYGFTHAIIKEYFEDNGNYSNLIALLAAKQSDIFYFIREMELRMDTENKSLNVQSIYAPEIPCHCMPLGTEYPSYDKHRALICEQMKKIMDRKYEVSSSRPLFITTPWEDLAAGASFDEPREFIGHIPLTGMPEYPDASVKFIPRHRVLSVLVRGDALPMDEIVAKLKERIEKDHLEVNGPLYMISMVGPHLGLDIPKERYLARIALPIVEK